MRKRSPVRCNAAQTNTPCIYKKGADCFFRGTNCTHLPCTEAPHAKTACDAAITALAKPLARVCIDVKGMTLDTVVRVYEGDSSSDTPYGPVSRPDVRLCADGADRPWRIEVDDRKGTKLEGTLDWSKGSCATLDLSAATLKMGCAEPFTGTPVEGRL